MIRKPGSVLADHLSSLDVATEIKRIITTNSGGKPRTKLSEWVHPLAADRVYRFMMSPSRTASSYLALFTLAP